MNLKELKKTIWKKKTLFQKVQWIWYSVEFYIQDKWWLLTGTCPHEGTIKKVGSKKEVCLLCGKEL